MDVLFRYGNSGDLKWLIQRDKHVDSTVLKEKLKKKEIIIIMESGTIIGWLRFGFFWDEIPFMNMLFIIEEYRRRGIGRNAVLFWESEMAGMGYRFVLTSTLSHEEAQHFYRKLSYRDIGGFIIPNENLEILLFKEIGE
jgi:ribosomal protein S18 acetylase RimI-like enzyme